MLKMIKISAAFSLKKNQNIHIIHYITHDQLFESLPVLQLLLCTTHKEDTSECIAVIFYIEFCEVRVTIHVAHFGGTPFKF
jgi:hypothetical protein